MVVGKAHGHNIGIQLLINSYIERYSSFSKVGMVSFYVLWAQISVLVSCHVIRKSTSQSANNLVWRVVGSTSDSSWHIPCSEPLLSMLFQAVGFWLYLKEIFLCLGLTVTEIIVNAVSSSGVLVVLERNIFMLRSNCN